VRGDARMISAPDREDASRKRRRSEKVDETVAAKEKAARISQNESGMARNA